MPIVKQKLTVRSVDRAKFVDTLLELGAKGAVRVDNAVPKMIMPFMAELEIEVERDAQLKSTPNMIAYPCHFETYSIGQLEEMIWPEFREAVALAGVKGRDRDVMLARYIEVVSKKI